MEFGEDGGWSSATGMRGVRADGECKRLGSWTLPEYWFGTVFTLGEDRLCLQVVIGVREYATKELLAVEDGYPQEHRELVERRTAGFDDSCST